MFLSLTRCWFAHRWTIHPRNREEASLTNCPAGPRLLTKPSISHVQSDTHGVTPLSFWLYWGVINRCFGRVHSVVPGTGLPGRTGCRISFGVVPRHLPLFIIKRSLSQTSVMPWSWYWSSSYQRQIRNVDDLVVDRPTANKWKWIVLFRLSCLDVKCTTKSYTRLEKGKGPLFLLSYMKAWRVFFEFCLTKLATSDAFKMSDVLPNPDEFL